MRVKVFVVFHKAIDERLIFSAFSEGEIGHFFSLYAVNAKFPVKSVSRMNGETLKLERDTGNVVFEYHLAWHDPLLQQRGFMETSCYVHLLKNDLLASYDYIGITQYDMRWKPEAAGILRAIDSHSGPTDGTAYGIVCGPLMNEAGELHQLAFAASFNWDFLLSSYNEFFSQHWDKSILINKPLTLFQTYILPREEFIALASWLEVLCKSVYPWASLPPYPTHWGRLGGYTERAECLFIAARIHEGRIRLGHLPMTHDSSIPTNLGISKDHYGKLQIER